MYIGADVSAVDKDGNSPLHVAQLARPMSDQVGSFKKVVFCISVAQETLTLWVTGVLHVSRTVMILSFWTDRSGVTVQTQIRLSLEEKSNKGLHCLQFLLHLLDALLYGKATLFNF